MLADRTYLLFRPRSTLPNERLNIRSETSSPILNPLSSCGSFDRLNHLTNSPSSSRRNDFLTSSTASPRLLRRTFTFSASDYRNPSVGNSLLSSSSMHSSPNMEKREALMSSFARHTSTRPRVPSYGLSYNSRTGNRNLSNGYSTSNLSSIGYSSSVAPLPPRPKHSTFLSRQSGRYTHAHSHLSSNYGIINNTLDSLQEYYRPTIRQRPQFSAIRKSIMQRTRTNVEDSLARSRREQAASTTVNQLSQIHHKPSIGNLNLTFSRQSSVFSGGSSGGLSRSSSGSGSSLYQTVDNGNGGNRSRTASLDRTSGESTPADLRGRSVRKVDRYRSVIKFQEHNIGKSLEQRRRLISWDLVNSGDLNRIDSDLSSSDRNTSSGATIDVNNLGLWNVITDTTLLTNNSSTTTLSEAGEMQPSTMTRFKMNESAANTLDAQFAQLREQNHQKRLHLQQQEQQGRLQSGRLKQYKSCSLDQSPALEKAFESSSVTTEWNGFKTKRTVSVQDKPKKDYPSGIDVSVVNNYQHSDSSFKDSGDSSLSESQNDSVDSTKKKTKKAKKGEGTMKKILRSAGKTFALKKGLKGKLIEEMTDQSTKGVAETKQTTVNSVMMQSFAQSNLLKTDYVRLPETIESVCIQAPFVKTNFVSPEPIIEVINIQSELFHSGFKNPEAIVVTQASQPLKITKFQHPVLPPTQFVHAEWLPIKGEYHKLQKVQLEWNAKPTEFYRPQSKIEMCTLQQAMGNSEFFYISPSIQRTNTLYTSCKQSDFEFPTVIISANQPLSKFSYRKPPLPNQIVELKSDLLLTEASVHLAEKHTYTVESPYSRTSFHMPTPTNQESNCNNPFIISSTKRSNNFELKLSASAVFKSLESQACELLSKQQDLMCDSAISQSPNEIKSAKKPPKSKKKETKTSENKKAAQETDVAKENISVVANLERKINVNTISTADLASDELHSISTIKLNPTNSRAPLQDYAQTLSDPIFTSCNKTVQNKPKRIQFRKYNVDDFLFCSVLGRGSFGKVFLAELVGHGQYFAIKCLKKNVVIEDNDVESTMIERKVLALGSSNPYICKLFCTFQTPSYLCFAMEYLAGGDLMFHVQKMGRFNEDRARFYAAEIVCALKFLHRRYIIYRDLKLDNILLDREGHIRLVDFGMCQCKTYRQECLPSNFCGTPDYMAPEIIKGIKYNHSVDWWSFGVLLYEMLIGKSPFTGADEDELLWNVCNEKVVFPLFLSKESVQIIGSLLDRNSDKRLGMPNCPAGEVTQQPFFYGINWQHADTKLLRPPFAPDLKSADDISNFDKEFTEAEPALTPVSPNITNQLDHNLFDGFSYTNPNLTD